MNKSVLEQFVSERKKYLVLYAEMIKSAPELFKQFRREKGFSQEKLAEALGVGNTFISRIEIGASKPSYRVLEELLALWN